MAGRRLTDLSRTFRRDPLLREFYLDGVSPTGKALGVGSYGSVIEVRNMELVKLPIAKYIPLLRKEGVVKKIILPRK